MRTNPQETVDLVTFTEDILNGKLYLLCSALILQTNTQPFSQTWPVSLNGKKFIYK